MRLIQNLRRRVETSQKKDLKELFRRMLMDGKLGEYIYFNPSEEIELALVPHSYANGQEIKKAVLMNDGEQEERIAKLKQERIYTSISFGCHNEGYGICVESVQKPDFVLPPNGSTEPIRRRQFYDKGSLDKFVDSAFASGLRADAVRDMFVRKLSPSQINYKTLFGY